MSNSCGAIWVRKDKNGNTYYSVSLEINGQKQNFAIFKNKTEEHSRKPQYSILKSEPRQKAEQVVNPITAEVVSNKNEEIDFGDIKF